MSDVNEWLKERRRIHDAATEGPWEWEGESDEDWPQSDNSLMAGGEAIVVGWGYDASGVTVGDEDATAITDAHNTLPATLTAIEKVLELHRPEAFEDEYSSQSGFMCESCYDPDKNEWIEWPCETVRTIEGAIK